MYMIGQAAAMLDKVITTITELHDTGRNRELYTYRQQAILPPVAKKTRKKH
jgi:hypothetical protein